MESKTRAEQYNKYRNECLSKSYDLIANGEAPLWMYPHCRWLFYGELLHKAKSYAEFAMMSVMKGFVNPDSARRHDETLNLIYRHEPYEDFIYEESGSHRGSGKMNAKARKFRDEMIELEKQNGERDKDGFVIPTKYELMHSRQTREWCHKWHPNHFKIRGVEDDIS